MLQVPACEEDVFDWRRGYASDGIAVSSQALHDIASARVVYDRC